MSSWDSSKIAAQVRRLGIWKAETQARRRMDPWVLGLNLEQEGGEQGLERDARA